MYRILRQQIQEKPMTISSGTSSFTNLLSKVRSVESTPTERLHCLDYLRVFAIAVLVVYHTCMVYVPQWGYHFKQALNTDSIQYVMSLCSPWRMGLLWLIAGIALAHMSYKHTIIKLLVKRSCQILLPLLVGVVFIVPVQLFAEMKQAGDMPLDIFAFLSAFYFQPGDYFIDYASGIWPRFDVNHLWFLRSLWRFSVVLIVLSPFLFSRVADSIALFLVSKLRYVIWAFIIPVAIIESTLDGEIVRESYGFVLLFIGFYLARHLAFLQTLSRHMNLLCFAALVAMLSLQFGFATIWKSGVNETNSFLNLLILLIYAANKVFPILAIIALAHRFLNRPNKQIQHLNTFVFPLYIIHQSVIICFAYFAANSGNVYLQTPLNQMIVNVLMTPIICLLLLMVISRVNLLRVCFGMRLKGNVDMYQKKTLSYMVLLICLPMIIQLI